MTGAVPDACKWGCEQGQQGCTAAEFLSGEQSHFATAHFGGTDHLSNCLCPAQWGFEYFAYIAKDRM